VAVLFLWNLKEICRIPWILQNLKHIFSFSLVLQMWKNEVIQTKLEIYPSKIFLLYARMNFIKWSLYTRVMAQGLTKPASTQS
jgi:prephenate dehydrogenase